MFTVTTTRTHDESSRGDRGVYRNNRRTTTSKQCTKVAVFGWINEHAPKNCMPLRDNTLNFHFKLFHQKKSSPQPSIQRSIATDLKSSYSTVFNYWLEKYHFLTQTFFDTSILGRDTRDRFQSILVAGLDFVLKVICNQKLLQFFTSRKAYHYRQISSKILISKIASNLYQNDAVFKRYCRVSCV